MTLRSLSLVAAGAFLVLGVACSTQPAASANANAAASNAPAKKECCEAKKAEADCCEKGGQDCPATGTCPEMQKQKDAAKPN